jgi:hypothetical protein
MNLEEYREWLKENSNQEEKMAYEVAQKIVNYHISDWAADYEVSCHPRKVFQTDKERLEFDLIIELEWESNRKYRRLIGVEFKETDFGKVVVQAIARCDFVDYMYVATRNVIPDSYDLLRLFDFGIGWIVWEEDFVKLLFPAHFRRYSGVSRLIDYLARRALEQAIEEMKLERRIAENMSLLDFVEVDG